MQVYAVNLKDITLETECITFVRMARKIELKGSYVKIVKLFRRKWEKKGCVGLV